MQKQKQSHSAKKKFYTLKDVKKFSGCTHRQLQYWEAKNYLVPTLGPRNVRYYTAKDLKIIKELVKAKKNGATLGEAWGKQQKKVLSKAQEPKVVTHLLKKLHLYEQKIKKLRQERDFLLTKIPQQTQHKSYQDNQGTNKIDNTLKTLDGLILYWMKKNQNYTKEELLAARKNFSLRLAQGESLAKISKDI